ncbi:MAG: hypothetical protein K2P64_10630 [Lachnospiraceae bacterium]|nr:hypothetical protein [Lachnospiraceae bacterium]
MKHKKIYPSYFILLSLTLYLVFYMAPSAMGLAYSFTDWNAMSNEVHFVGF